MCVWLSGCVLVQYDCVMGVEAITLQQKHYLISKEGLIQRKANTSLEKYTKNVMGVTP